MQLKGLRITLPELEIIDQSIRGFYEGINGNKEFEGRHFVCQISINANTRNFMVSIIVDIYEGYFEYRIVDISEISDDEYLDNYNETYKHD
jgi:hypothetical protein